jgi:capsule polysaccharide modification protein KpsS
VHRSNPDPFELFDRVKVKIIFTILKPSFRMFALEDRKIDLRKFAGRAPATTALISRVPMMRRCMWWWALVRVN